MSLSDIYDNEIFLKGGKYSFSFIIVTNACPKMYHFVLFQDLEFHGVMRFYFQDKAAGNFATKCIRVSSTATTQDVIETLAEKFRPDMRMLSSPKYSLYEVHVSGGQCIQRLVRGVSWCCTWRT